MTETLQLSPGHQRFLDLQAARLSFLKETFAEHFSGGQAVTLEIGCGHGHYLTAYAQAHPGERCLGIDISTKRIAKACKKRDKRNLTNLHFIKAEVRELFMAWPDTLMLNRIFILFPDPWPKKRHIKNRIIQNKLLGQLACHARVEAQLHFRTDDQANFAWGKEVIEGHPNWKIVEDVAWPFESPSFFQDLLGSRFSLTALYNS